MPKAKERDGVFQRKDRAGWWVSYIDASGKRRKEGVTAHTRTQALNALSAPPGREKRRGGYSSQGRVRKSAQSIS